MILINKVNNAIQIVFEGNDKYLHNGVIDVAVNDLILVIDESNMATFKRSSTGDVLFSQVVDNIQISGESVSKDNIIEKFAAVGYGSTGGGSVDLSNYYTKSEIDKKNYMTKDEAYDDTALVNRIGAVETSLQGIESLLKEING